MFIHRFSSVFAVLLLSPCLVYAGNHHRVTVKGGDVHFSGAVEAAPCVVSQESADQKVEMGQVRTSDFSSLGSWSDPVEFTINLKECDTTIAQQVGVTFRGVTDGKDPTVLMAGQGAGSAEGIGLGIFDSRGVQVIPNTRPQTFTMLEDGENVLYFRARYRSTSRTVTGGDASAQTWFTLTYS